MSNILITICARGGSKGIPGKNIKMIAGKPLMAYTVEIAKKFIKSFDAEIILSTDSESIKSVGKELGIFTDSTRPSYLANDTVGKPDTIKDAMIWYELQTGKKVDFVIDQYIKM